MNRISAGGNLAIEIEPERWRLIANGADSERALVEASPGEPLRYIPAFGSTRRLPDTGLLPTQYVQRVVLGWSNEDEAWHLGFLLEPELAAPRGSRWCEIAYWPDPEGDLFVATARHAGESLAQTMARPFHYVPARPAVQENGAPVRAVEPAPLPPLPAKIDLWSVAKRDAGQIELTLAPQVQRSRLLRAIWYLMLSVVYFFLSAITLTSGIALPRPEILPFIGLAAAALLLFLSLRSVITPGYKIDRLVVHPEAKAIRGLRKGVERWRFEAEDLKAIYVTQLVQKPRRNGTQTITYGELNLQLKDDGFHHVLQQGAVELDGLTEADMALGEGIMPLTPEIAKTGLQTLGLHIASMLGLPAYGDRRTK